MQSVINFTIRKSVKRYGVNNLYRDLLKLSQQNITDKKVRQNIQSTLKEGFRSNWTPNMMLQNKNVEYLISRSNLEKHKKLGKLYVYSKDFC